MESNRSGDDAQTLSPGRRPARDQGTWQIDGESYRMRGHRVRLDQQRRALWPRLIALRIKPHQNLGTRLVGTRVMIVVARAY